MVVVMVMVMVMVMVTSLAGAFWELCWGHVVVKAAAMAGVRRVCTAGRESMRRLMPSQPSCAERRVERIRQRRRGKEVMGTLIIDWIYWYVNRRCIHSSLSTPPCTPLLALSHQELLRDLDGC